QFFLGVVWLCDDRPQTLAAWCDNKIVNHIDIGIRFARRFCFSRQLVSRNCCREHQRNGDCRSNFHLALAALTTFCAASARSSAVITGRPESAINFLPPSTFVPSSLTTSGTDSFTVFAALTMPCAMTLHFIIP